MNKGKEFFCEILTEIDSTQDAAYKMAEDNLLPPWGSVLALNQTAGRGQMRKRWASLEGNIMASLRLPDDPLFTTPFAAIATGAITALALRRMNFNVYLKWPNDLVIINKNIPQKVAGILIEERNNIIIAGIGINLVSAPNIDELDDSLKLAPGILLEKGGMPPVVFWKELLTLMHQIYNKGSFSKYWLNSVNYMLFAKDQKTTFKTPQKNWNAILKGINDQGEIILSTDEGIKAFSSGELEFF